MHNSHRHNESGEKSATFKPPKMQPRLSLTFYCNVNHSVRTSSIISELITLRVRWVTSLNSSKHDQRSMKYHYRLRMSDLEFITTTVSSLSQKVHMKTIQMKQLSALALWLLGDWQWVRMWSPLDGQGTDSSGPVSSHQGQKKQTVWDKLWPIWSCDTKCYRLNCQAVDWHSRLKEDI